jgi:GT2 family glycosyltransferase
MRSTDDLESTLQRLSQDQRLLDELRADYVTIRRSRFYGMHAVWAGLKQFFSGRLLFPPEAAVNRPENVTAISEDERASVPELLAKLCAGWKWRTQQQPLSQDPVVTVVIPVFNNVRVTVRCLQSFVDTWFESLPVRIILMDDASEDETRLLEAALPGLTYMRNETNSGFLLSCNRAAQGSKSKYVCFLNNDTTVTNGWLDELVLTADSSDDIGAVGSKLLFPNGKLQEAGGIIWSDASGWNYGREDDAEDPRYNYVRNVDYCSGAALLVRTDVFERLGGFDERFAPAYFEDSDLCFSLRALGYRVVYQPKSVVVHYEGATSGRSVESGVKRHQTLNKPKFVEKWRDKLRDHLENNPKRALQAARRLGRPKTLIMIDNYVPEFDKDSGSNKLYHLIREFQNVGFDVIYAPDNFHRSEPYTSVFQRLGVEVLYRCEGQRSLEHSLRARLPLADLVWIGRPEIASKWITLVREHAPGVAIAYDTHDLHYLRRKRELEVKGIEDPAEWEVWRRARSEELKVIRSVDIPITVTDLEKSVLEDQEDIFGVFVVPNVHEIHDRVYPYGETSGILFIGSFSHEPNVDSALFLCNEIMPLVWAQKPDATVTLLGTNPPASVLSLKSARVTVPGYVHDVTPYFERARVFVAPLRYGAGLKGKIGHALSYRVPTVTTAVGAEGFDLEHGRDALIVDGAAGFAREVLRVYDDQLLWQKLADNGARCIERYSPEKTRQRLRQLAKIAEQRRSNQR